VPVCPNCKENNPERARFCLACGTVLPGAAPPAREARKTVTVLFTDVTGSTALAEHNDPEAMRSVMERYFDRMKQVIEQHGGTVEKFIGDAIMAVFGVPEIHEDDALRAVRAAADMRQALADLNNELERERGIRITVRTGINTGPVVAGDPSAGQRLVTGDAVNVGARLEQAAHADEILIGAETYGLVRGAVTVEPIDPVPAKGKSEPVPAYRLTAVTPGAAGVTRRLDAPIVGREHELALLMQAFERAVRERSCHLFTVLGSAGVGKSRLVGEILAALEDEATIMRGRCLPYGEGITFFPIMEAIPEVAGIRDDDSPEEARAKIAALTAGAEHSDRITGAITELMDLAEGSTPLEEKFWAVRRLLEHLARQRPVVVEFDDIHWAEPKFLDLIEHIADWTRDAPILLVCVARHELLERRQGWGGGKLNATSLNLEPLTSKECDRLVEFLLGEANLADEVKERIAEAAEGNPLFVEETLSMLIDDGTLVLEEGRWIPSTELSTVAVPPTIQALLSARIDRLQPDERTTIECAAVAGKVFWHGAVVELAGSREVTNVDAHLLTLVRKDLIRQEPSTFTGEDAFRFRHLLVRDAAYQGIAKRVRADLHERYARWLTETTGDKAYEYEEIISYHYEQAHLNLLEVGLKDERAIRLGVEAGERLAAVGRRAAMRGDAPAAITLLRRAAQTLPRDHPVRKAVMPDLSLALEDTGAFDELRAVAAELDRIAGETNDEALSWHARVSRAALGVWVGEEGASAQASQVAEQAIDVFERLGHERGLLDAWRLASVVAWLGQEADETRRALENALEYGRRSGNRAYETSIKSLLVMAMVFGPVPWDEAIERSEEVLRESPSRILEANVLSIRATALSRRGRTEEAREMWRDSHTVIRDVGLQLHAAGMTQGAAGIEMDAGDKEGALRVLREGAEALDALGERATASTNLAMMATIEAELGKLDEAETLAMQAKEIADEHDLSTQQIWRQALSKVRADRGAYEEAERLAREALAIAERGDFIEIRGDSYVYIAGVFRTIGLTDEADALLAKAEDLYTAKGDPIRVENVRSSRANPEG
jgi:class 3 adenylate cyclase/tetratricopeptide (TPR) repeat protein